MRGKIFEDFPQSAKSELLDALSVVAEGGMPDIAKPLKSFGSGILELALRHRGEAFRVAYALQCRRRCMGDSRFPEEIEKRNQNAATGDRPNSRAPQAA